MKEKDFLLIGKVTGTHGIKGNIKAYAYAESAAVFKSGRLLRVAPDVGEARNVTINWSKPHNRVVLLSLEGIEDRAGAEALVGARLYVEKAELPQLDQGCYYWFELIGLSVFTTENVFLGRLEEIIPTGSNDVYVVRDANNDNREVLIPALASVVVDIDIVRQTMHVALPEGL